MIPFPPPLRTDPIHSKASKICRCAIIHAYPSRMRSRATNNAGLCTKGSAFLYSKSLRKRKWLRGKTQRVQELPREPTLSGSQVVCAVRCDAHYAQNRCIWWRKGSFPDHQVGNHPGRKAVIKRRALTARVHAPSLSCPGTEGTDRGGGLTFPWSGHTVHETGMRRDTSQKKDGEDTE